METNLIFQQSNVKKRVVVALLMVLFTFLTASCGKKDGVKKNKVENIVPDTDTFATQFFYDCNLPYEKMNASDVQNGVEEYLFYIPNGSVYRTLHDYAVVIVNRSELREPEERVNTNYSGEIYQIFEDDEIDVLKYSASGDYAIMASPSAIPDWENDEVITAFMEYSIHYHN